ncbi:class III lanthionine synthetase LanKC [Actinospica durhamensis]|uniref:non-specific serine/threonine protein kinase n=1 Tax=Actinospica durhamensis TaxID=1508375 RepID=A0A941ITN7_9ACTN|nr:class III lanthionine synthetase LanKC [Actinospica durhamensis]MBR7834536.1 class III lanthionine synthetase LanKC [Actinospica durhamensis]
MSDQHQALLYAVADHRYFETPSRLADDGERYPWADGPIPPGWIRADQGLWTSLRPAGAEPVEQGWKIHLSATPHTAGLTLERAGAVLLKRGVPFKFLRSRRAVELFSGKQMHRAASGKFLAAYPPDETWLPELLDALVAAVDGLPGPYILSDLRIGGGPVHVRYGAFVELWCEDADGVAVPALRDPSGRLVPDARGAVYRTPQWVNPPPELEPHLLARTRARDDDFPYAVRKALHFSNAGGIYLADHRVTGRQVVLREARPFAGLDGLGDALERLHREYRTLLTLRGLDCVPEVHGLHTVWEHTYLVEEYIEGRTLLEEMVERHPVAGRDCGPEALRSYARWAESVAASLRRALDAIHGRGVCFRDVHPSNIIVRPDGSVALVDFEYASTIDDPDLARVGARGFRAPAGATGVEADAYGVWATSLAMLMPITEMIEFAPEKAAVLEAAAAERFGLAGAGWPRRPDVGAAVTPDAAEVPDPVDDWPALRELLIVGIHACATPDREDRLFPADWAVFEQGGHTVAHGAAGVLLALARTGAPVPAHYLDWLVAACRRARTGIPRGLYDGLYGSALVLDELGRRQEARETLDRAGAAGFAPHAGIHSGQAGAALAYCHFAESAQDSALLDEAVRVGERLDALARGETPDGAGRLIAPTRAGLLLGFSGAAVLHLRLHDLTGERRWLLAARRALAHDVEHCVVMPDGTVMVRQGHRHLPYLDEGSCGIALVARDYLDRAEDPSLAALIDRVRPLAAGDFVREPGLLRGRAGLVAALAVLGPEGCEQEMARSVRALSWHAVRHRGGVLFPGYGLQKLSADLASGSAGVLLALHTVFDGKGERAGLLPAI